MLVDGVEADGLPLLNETEAGASYLHLRSTALSIDTAGWLVESVEADVGDKYLLDKH